MRKAIFAVALLLIATAISITGQVTGASATSSSVEVQFTKWLLEPMDPAGFPWEMKGIITGGDLGTGEYTGRALEASPAGGKTTLRAIYNFRAGGRSFTAQVVYVQDDSTLAATVSGTVTDGDFKGAKVSGTAQGYPHCPLSTPGNVVAPLGSLGNGLCFRVNLQIETSPPPPSISPPSTGDGGLADGTEGGGAGRTYAVVGLGAVVLLTLGVACRLIGHR